MILGVSILSTLHRHWKKEVSFTFVRSCSSNTTEASATNTTTATNVKEVAATTPDKTFIQDVVFNEYCKFNIFYNYRERERTNLI